MKPITIIDAPTPLGLRPPAPGRVPGTRHMPETFRALGFHDAIAASYGGEVSPGHYQAWKDPVHGILNPEGIRNFSKRLATQVERVLVDQRLPLVLGGDCSVVIGCALALCRRGRYGLAFLDGHADTLTPSTSSTGGVAGMDLAIVTGTGPDLLTNIDGFRPYLLERDVVQLGCRDSHHAKKDGSARLLGTEIRLIDLDELRRLGPVPAGERALAEIPAEVGGIWVHLDADVLDDTLMPSVDSRQEGGLTYGELEELLRTFLQSGRIIGMDVTIYDPDLDPSREVGRQFSQALREILT